MDRPGTADPSRHLQDELNSLARQLGVRPTVVGMRSNDDLNVFVDDEGVYHYAYWERGKLSFDLTGSLDDVLYWYCEGHASTLGHRCNGERKQAFQFTHDVLASYDPRWAKRYVRELAGKMRQWHPQDQCPADLKLLPDIGEPL